MAYGDCGRAPGAHLEACRCGVNMPVPPRVLAMREERCGTMRCKSSFARVIATYSRGRSSVTPFFTIGIISSGSRSISTRCWTEPCRAGVRLGVDPPPGELPDLQTLEEVGLPPAVFLNPCLRRAHAISINPARRSRSRNPESNAWRRNMASTGSAIPPSRSGRRATEDMPVRGRGLLSCRSTATRSLRPPAAALLRATTRTRFVRRNSCRPKRAPDLVSRTKPMGYVGPSGASPANQRYKRL